jgi:hypothetical protein
MWFLWLFQNPLGRKIGIVVACLIVFGLAVRWYGNKQYYAGHDEGIKSEAARLEVAKKAEWQVAMDQVKAMADQLDAQKKSVETQRVALENTYRMMLDSVKSIVTASNARIETRQEQVTAIPASEIDGAIRTQIQLPPANPPTTPLSYPEKQEVLKQLIKVPELETQVKALNGYVQDQDSLHQKEKANSDQALELEKKATELAQKERDLAKDQATFYKDLYQSVTKKTSLKCKIARVLTLGIYRCK